MIKTRQSRWLNRIGAAIASRVRWGGVVPKSVALMDHCKPRNYGTTNFAYVERKLKRLTNIMVRS